jgi:hypothetical protein
MPDSTRRVPRTNPIATATTTPEPELTDGILAEGSDTHSPTDDPEKEVSTTASGDSGPG